MMAVARLRPHKLVPDRAGILLDVSLGGTPQPRSVTLSPTGEVAHHPCRLPWPLESQTVHTAVVTHVLEYVQPEDIWRWFDELHRVMQPLGVAYFSGPYGGDESHGWLSDPQHRTRIVEQSFSWLDPRTPFYALHGSLGRPTPKPWHTLQIVRVPGAHGTYGYNCVLQKVVEDDAQDR